MNFGQRCYHPRVALVAHNTDRAFLGDAKIPPTDANISSEEDFAQDSARGIDQRRNIFGIFDTQFFIEKFRYILAAQMYSRSNDMRWFLATQLHNIFT